MGESIYLVFTARAMLAQYMLSSYVCRPSVRPSQYPEMAKDGQT